MKLMAAEDHYNLTEKQRMNLEQFKFFAIQILKVVT
jgi:hypothetical protein